MFVAVVGVAVVGGVLAHDNHSNYGDAPLYDDHSLLMEIKETVSKYIPMCSIQQLEVEESENGIGLVVKMKYIVKSNNSSQEYSVSINI